jgi:hypothetical protein
MAASGTRRLAVAAPFGASEPKGERPMSTASLTVPWEQRDDFLAQLLSTYASKLDAVLDALNNALEQDRGLDALLANRAELEAIEQLVERLGWAFGIHRGGTATTLTGDVDLLREAVGGVLEHALQEAADQVGRHRTGPLRDDKLEGHLASVQVILDLADQLDPGRSESARSSDTDPAEKRDEVVAVRTVGAVFAREWVERTTEAEARAVLDGFPELPQQLDSELLRAAENEVGPLSRRPELKTELRGTFWFTLRSTRS